MYVERTLSRPLAAASRQFPVILIPSPRQVGKTTPLRQPAKKDIRNFSVLDHLDVPRGPGAVLCLTESPMPITEAVWAIPVSQI